MRIMYHAPLPMGKAPSVERHEDMLWAPANCARIVAEACIMLTTSPAVGAGVDMRTDSTKRIDLTG